MKPNKNLISYALGISLLVCGYSILTNIAPSHRSGICSASNITSNSKIIATIKIVENDQMAEKEFFLPDFINCFASIDHRIKKYLEYTQTLEGLEHLNADQLAQDIGNIFSRQKFEKDFALLKYRILEMEIFQAFRLFVSMDPAAIKYTWEDIRLQLCKTLEEMRALSGDFKNIEYEKLLLDLNKLKGSSVFKIGWVLRKYLPLLPKSIQNKCGLNLAKLIK